MHDVRIYWVWILHGTRASAHRCVQRPGSEGPVVLHGGAGVVKWITSMHEKSVDGDVIPHKHTK